MTDINLDQLAADIQHVTDILKADGIAAASALASAALASADRAASLTKRLDLLQADMEALMREDFDAVWDRAWKAWDRILAEGNHG